MMSWVRENKAMKQKKYFGLIQSGYVLLIALIIAIVIPSIIQINDMRNKSSTQPISREK